MKIRLRTPYECKPLLKSSTSAGHPAYMIIRFVNHLYNVHVSYMYVCTMYVYEGTYWQTTMDYIHVNSIILGMAYMYM